MLFLFVMLDRGCAKGTLKFIFGGLIILKLLLHAQYVIRYGDLSNFLGDYLSCITILRSLLIIEESGRFLIGLHNVIGNL
jgi:hypothetical protein